MKLLALLHALMRPRMVPMRHRFADYEPPRRYGFERLSDFRARQVDAVLVRAEFDDAGMWV